MHKQTIGILGGLGPESSANFYKQLIQEFQKLYSPKANTDYPHIVLNSIPAPDFMMNESERVLGEYVEGLKLLESAGADYIVIVCNTAHNFLDAYRKEVKTPIVDLRSVVEGYFKNNKIESYVVFGTGDTISKGLYSFENMGEVQLKKEEIIELDKAITAINLGHKEEGCAYIKKLYDKYNTDVNSILLACTEVSTALAGEQKTIDTMELLLGETLKLYGKGN